MKKNYQMVFNTFNASYLQYDFVSWSHHAHAAYINYKQIVWAHLLGIKLCLYDVCVCVCVRVCALDVKIIDILYL